MLEPTVLFANKKTLITLLPDGSLLKSTTDADGVEKVVEAGLFAKIIYAGKIAKAKSSYPLSDQSEVKKSKVEKAWEAYAETDEAYTNKNKIINDIAKKVAECKELIVETDKNADTLLASATTRMQEMVDQFSGELKKVTDDLNLILNSHSNDADKIAELMLQQAQAKQAEKMAVDKANALIDEVTLKVYSLKEAPRQALKYLENELANATKPDSEITKKDDSTGTILGVEPEAK